MFILIYTGNGIHIIFFQENGLRLFRVANRFDVRPWTTSKALRNLIYNWRSTIQATEVEPCSVVPGVIVWWVPQVLNANSAVIGPDRCRNACVSKFLAVRQGAILYNFTSVIQCLAIKLEPYRWFNNCTLMILSNSYLCSMSQSVYRKFPLSKMVLNHFFSVARSVLVHKKDSISENGVLVVKILNKTGTNMYFFLNIVWYQL